MQWEDLREGMEIEINLCDCKAQEDFDFAYIDYGHHPILNDIELCYRNTGRTGTFRITKVYEETAPRMANTLILNNMWYVSRRLMEAYPDLWEVADQEKASEPEPMAERVIHKTPMVTGPTWQETYQATHGGSCYFCGPRDCRHNQR